MAAKILILSASVGAGHLRAAQALETSFTQHGATVRNIDILTLTSDLFKKAYSKTYMELVNRAPHVVGYFYDLTDKPANPGKDDSLALPDIEPDRLPDLSMEDRVISARVHQRLTGHTKRSGGKVDRDDWASYD